MEKKLRMSKRLVDHFINAILIFASVFLAFWLNEVRIEEKESELTQNAKEAVLTEWKINLIILERSKAYHEDMLNRRLEIYFKNLDTLQTFSLQLIPGFDERIQKETITNNSRGLVEDQQIKFDLNTRLTINQINVQQTNLFRATDALTNGFFRQRELYDKSKVMENYSMFYSLLGELVEEESIMIERLKTVINEYEE